MVMLSSSIVVVVVVVEFEVGRVEWVMMVVEGCSGRRRSGLKKVVEG